MPFDGWRNRWGLGGAAALALLGGSGWGGAQTGQPIDLPKVTLPLTPAPANERSVRARVEFAPYRYDDLLWENDRTAHRIYGPALEAYEPPSTSGIDAWGKIVAWPFMRRQLKSGEQHGFHGEGVDFYHVGGTRGAGGLGIWHNNKLWVSRNFKRYRILRNGPDIAQFEVDYAPWPVDVGRKVWETRRFTLPAGTSFTRMVSTLSSDRPGSLIVGIGITKHPTSEKNGDFVADRAHGVITFWSPTDPELGAMGVALLVDPQTIVDVREDLDHYLVLLKETPGKPFVYYMGAAWSKAGRYPTADAWRSYAMAQIPSYR